MSDRQGNVPSFGPLEGSRTGQPPCPYLSAAEGSREERPRQTIHCERARPGLQLRRTGHHAFTTRD
jgi:hypothetical protein